MTVAAFGWVSLKDFWQQVKGWNTNVAKQNLVHLDRVFVLPVCLAVGICCLRRDHSMMGDDDRGQLRVVLVARCDLCRDLFRVRNISERRIAASLDRAP